MFTQPTAPPQATATTAAAVALTLPGTVTDPGTEKSGRRQRTEWIQTMIRESIMQNKYDRGAWSRAASPRAVSQTRQGLGRPRRLVLLGAPGVGKGTQAELLSERFSICHLSTTDIFRAARTLGLCDCTPAMTRALGHLAAGELVPDQTVLSLVAERSGCVRCGGGFLIEGFPRALAQAEALDQLLAANKASLDAVVCYELPVEKIVARLSGRRTCHNCRAVFHVNARKPRRPGLCDHCGLVLHQREEDRPDAIRVRMEAYQQHTLPLVEFYRKRGLLVSISADGTPAQVFERTLEAFEGRRIS